MNRLFIREKDPIDKNPYNKRRKIGILGMGPTCGVTSIGTTLAKLASKEEKGRIQYLEITTPNQNMPLVFDALGMDKRFVNRGFVDFYDEVKKGNPIGHLLNMEEGISWALVTKETVKRGIRLSTKEKIHLINNLSYDLLFCDLELGTEPWNKMEEEKSLLSEMSRLIFVIDPVPSKLLGSYPLLQWVKAVEEKGLPVSYIVNKHNKGVQKRDFFDFIKLKPDHFIPYYSPEEFYICEYNCQFTHRINGFRESLAEFSQSEGIFT